MALLNFQYFFLKHKIYLRSFEDWYGESWNLFERRKFLIVGSFTGQLSRKQTNNSSVLFPSESATSVWSNRSRKIAIGVFLVIRPTIWPCLFCLLLMVFFRYKRNKFIWRFCSFCLLRIFYSRRLQAIKRTKFIAFKSFPSVFVWTDVTILKEFRYLSNTYIFFIETYY